MGKIGGLGGVVGGGGLMGKGKSGSVSMDVGKGVKEVKEGKIEFKVDKGGIMDS